MNINLHSISLLVANIKVNYNAKNKVSTAFRSKHLLNLLFFLKINGYISSYDFNKQSHKVTVHLKYRNSKPIIHSIYNYIKHNRKRTLSTLELKKLSKKHPLIIILTSQGFMFLNKAVKKNLTGILLFEIQLL